MKWDVNNAGVIETETSASCCEILKEACIFLGIDPIQYSTKEDKGDCITFAHRDGIDEIKVSCY